MADARLVASGAGEVVPMGYQSVVACVGVKVVVVLLSASFLDYLQVAVLRTTTFSMSIFSCHIRLCPS